MSHTVFISSTRQDLIPYRAAVRERLLEEGFQPIAMETMGARSEWTLEACENDVGKGDFFVGIYAWRYGFVPPGQDASITELELRAARAMGKNALFFVVKDDPAVRWPEEHREGGEGARRLAELKRRLMDRQPVAEFTDPNDLAAKVVSALHRHLQRKVSRPSERRALIDFWEVVRRSWIVDVLDVSLPEGRRIRIARADRPEAVGHTGWPPDRAEEGLISAAAKPIHDLFDDEGRRLLILGATGAGKTTLLLELARELGRLARASPGEPIPVVFNLASWNRRQRLSTWMTDELRVDYLAGEDEAKRWVESNQILPLLDGLDEVQADCRHGCVEAINEYLTRRGREVRLAVCCQTEVYGELPPLSLDSAVELRALTPDQVDRHLAGGGPDLAGLRAAVAGSRELGKLAESPLLLTLLEQTYRGDSAAAIDAQQEDEVFARYVQRAFESKLPWTAKERPRGFRDRLPWRKRRERGEIPLAKRYPPATARRLLTWLARAMADHNPASFQVERLQPSWLGSRKQVWAYAVVSRALGGALLALPLVWIFRSAGLSVLTLVLGLLCGALIGSLDAIDLRRRPGRAGPRWLRRPVGRGFLICAGTALVMFFVGRLWLQWFPTGSDRPDFRNLLRVTVFLAPLFGLIFGSRGASRHGRHDVRVREAWRWRKWSWRGARLGGVWGAVAGVALSAVAAFGERSLADVPLSVWFVFALAFALFGAMTGGAVGAFRGRALEVQLSPNRGTWLALQNAAVVGLFVALAAAAAFALFRGSSALALAVAGAGKGIRWRDIYGAAAGGVALGIWMGLWFSGLDFVQHFTLRGVLCLARTTPVRLVRFLEYARSRGPLQRPGRSYKFFHPRLLEHLARSDDGGRTD